MVDFSRVIRKGQGLTSLLYLELPDKAGWQCDAQGGPMWAADRDYTLGDIFTELHAGPSRLRDSGFSMPEKFRIILTLVPDYDGGAEVVLDTGTVDLATFDALATDARVFVTDPPLPGGPAS